MAKCLVLRVIVFQSVSLFGAPVLFICDRPAWEGVGGYGETKTFERYAIYVTEQSVHADRVADKEARGYLRPAHVFFKAIGCDLEGEKAKRGRFEVDIDLITFWRGDVRIGDGILAKKLVLDLESLSAELDKVDYGSELTCTAQYVDAIPYIHRRVPSPWGNYNPQRYPRR